MKTINQVLILAGGKGTRMREMTSDLPKPMVKIGERPVLEHLINIFNHFGSFEFVVCTGYLSEIIEEYFKDYDNVKIVNTGYEANTGARVLAAKEYIQDEFIVTYGDGLANVKIDELLNFHNRHNKIGTITVTNPISRFGLVKFDKRKKVLDFIEKPTLEGFINMGFMVFKKDFLNFLDSSSVLESTPLENLASQNELFAFEHTGFFQPMDTYREYIELNKLWNEAECPWMNFE